MSHSSTLLDELPPLSDRDIEILYAIVCRAAESTDLPFRALFAAYDEVLPENGIRPAHDQKYFRYLLRLGEGPTTAENSDLIARFHRLLARLGIQLVVQEDEDGGGEHGDVTRASVTAADDYEDARQLPRAGEARGARKRRSSFNDSDAYAVDAYKKSESGSRRPHGRNSAHGKRRLSFNDSHLEETWVSGGRLDPDESITDGHVNGSAARPVPRTAKTNGHPQHVPLHTQRRTQRSSSNAGIPTGQRARSLSTQDSKNTGKPGQRRQSRPPPHYQDYEPTYDESDWPNSESDLESYASSPPRPRHHALYEPAPAASAIPEPPATHAIPLPQLLASADAFYTTTTFRTARRLLHHWHDHTIRERQARYDLTQIATNYDRQTLLLQAFSMWRSSLDEKRQAAETDRFFDHLERRATRARDAFLLNKAFTHWAQSASEEVARTNVARRHILRVRYFNAWRDITAVNQLKCRRIGLKKWFPVWRAKAARRAIENERALAIHEEKLVERMYWKWFWACCEKKAPIWRETRLKRSVLLKITACAAKVAHLESTAQQMRHYQLARHALTALGVHGQSVNLLDAQATRYRRTSLLSRAFGTLRKHSQLAPRWRQYTQAASSRLAAKSIHVWSVNTTLARQATAFHQQKLLQTAVIDWNDALRTKVVTTMIDERVKAEAYYKWVLAERLALFRRMMDYRLVQRTFETLSIRLTETRFRLEEAAAMFHEDQRRRLLQSVMLKLNRRTRDDEYMERQALEFRNVHVMRDILPTWRKKHDHVQQLERWSADARFYCLAHSTIRSWKEATTKSKRARRRDAYATVRRRVKFSLVHRCFSRWHEKSLSVRRMEEQAQERYQTKLLSFAGAALDKWRQRTHRVVDMSIESDEIHVKRLFSSAVLHLTAKGQQILQNRQEADEYVEQTVHAAIKSEMMKRLKWSLFCLKRNKENASALKDRNSEQHRRNMIRFWADQAMQRRALKTAADPESPSKPEPNMFSSLRLPSARKPTLTRPATTGHLPDSMPNSDAIDYDDDEIDFGASSTARAEEWTSYDLLRDFSTAALPTLDEESEPSSAPHAAPAHIATPLPGYLRTPSKRTARQRNRFKAMSARRPATAFAATPARVDDLDDAEARGVQDRDFLVSTTPAPLRPGGLQDMGALTPQVTPFERKMRAGGFGRSSAFGSTTPGFGRSRFGRSMGPATTGRSVRFFDTRSQGGADVNVDVDGHEKSS